MSIDESVTETGAQDALPTTSAPPRVPWGAVALFTAIAYGLAWVITIPLWRSGGLANPLITPLGLVMMATPAIGALVVTFGVLKPAHPARYLGLVPLRPWRRVVGCSLLGFLGVQVLGVLAVVLGSVLGVAPLATPAGTAAALATVPALSALVAIPALGEELGWRGFLLPTLRPLGTWPALVVSGVLWGVWHAPLILLGYNYGYTDVRGVALMTVTTVLVGILFGWLRMRSASVYPSALAHGALNASVGVFVVSLIPAADRTVSSSLLGWVGWVLLAVVIAVVALTRSARWAEPVPELPRAADR